MKDYTKLYVNGEWIASSGGTEVDLINPATERAVGRISLATSADVDVAVKAARHALKTFSLTTREEEAKRIAAGVVATVTCGDPTTEVYMGPLVSERQWNRVQGLIRKGIDEGGTLVAGGLDRPAGLNVGYYVKPTIFADVSSDMTIAREEIFGPVLAIIGYKDVDDAVAIANDTPYGLGAFVQAGTDERANEIAARIEAGMVYINGAGEDANAPFGGYKMSGNGREWGEIAFTDFLETKAVIHRTAA
jgi:aldehyde dehydrogenase (NAD+)